MQQRRPGHYDTRHKLRKTGHLSPLPATLRLSTVQQMGVKKAATIDARQARKSRNLDIPDSPFKFPTSCYYFPDMDNSSHQRTDFAVADMRGQSNAFDTASVGSGNSSSSSRIKVGRKFTTTVDALTEVSEWDMQNRLMNNGNNNTKDGSRMPSTRPRSPLITALKQQREQLLADAETLKKEQNQQTYKQFILDFGSLDDDKLSIGIVDTKSARANRKHTLNVSSSGPVSHMRHSADNIVPESIIKQGIERLRKDYKNSRSTPQLTQEPSLLISRQQSSHSRSSEI